MTDRDRTPSSFEHDHRQSPASGSPSIAKASAVLNQWIQDVGRRDVSAVLGLYAPDAILVPTMSDEVRDHEEKRREYFESFLANEGLRCGITMQKARASDGHATVAIGGLYCFTMRSDGQDKVVPARFLFTFEDIDGHWLITSHHSSQAVE